MKYNKLEIVVTELGDYHGFYWEDNNSKCWNRECNGIGKMMLEETFGDYSEGSWWLKQNQAVYRWSFFFF